MNKEGSLGWNVIVFMSERSAYSLIQFQFAFNSSVISLKVLRIKNHLKIDFLFLGRNMRPPAVVRQSV